MAPSGNTGGNKIRTALVTGGSQRVGAAISLDLAKSGFRVVIHYNDSLEEAEETLNAVKESGGEAWLAQADLTRAEDCAGLIAAAREVAGPLDLLVNNASIFKPDSAEAPDLDLWDAHFAIHARAPALMAADFAAQSEPERGLIVNMIDQRVWALTPNFYSYTLSKATLWAATRTMAQAFAPRIRVNAIGPGPTLPNERQSQADFEQQLEALILKRGPDLAEFGATIRYLYETESITGQMIALDGGQHLAWETPDVTGIRE